MLSKALGIQRRNEDNVTPATKARLIILIFWPYSVWKAKNVMSKSKVLLKQ
jgi:hypothetical protein